MLLGYYTPGYIPRACHGLVASGVEAQVACKPEGSRAWMGFQSRAQSLRVLLNQKPQIFRAKATTVPVYTLETPST